jgi:hypothetical protein
MQENPNPNPYLLKIDEQDAKKRQEKQAQAEAAARQKKQSEQEVREAQARAEEKLVEEGEGGEEGEGAVGEEEQDEQEAPKKTPSGAKTFFAVLGVGVVLAAGFALFGAGLAASIFFAGPIGLGLLVTAALLSPFVLFYGGRAFWNGLKSTAEKAQKNSIAIGMLVGIAALAVCLVFAPAVLGAGLAVFVALGAFAISTLLGFLFRVAQRDKEGNQIPFTTREKIAIALSIGIVLGVAVYFALPLILGAIGVAALAGPLLIGIVLAVGGLPLLAYGAARLLMVMARSPILSGLAVGSFMAAGLLIAAAAGAIALTFPIFIVAVVLPLLIGLIFKYRDAIARFFGFTPKEPLASADMAAGAPKNNVLVAEADVKAALAALAKLEPLTAKAATAAGKAEKEKEAAIKEAKAANAALLDAQVELKIAEKAFQGGDASPAAQKAVEKAKQKVDDKKTKAAAAREKAEAKIALAQPLTAEHQKRIAEERVMRLVLEDPRKGGENVQADAQNALAELIARAEETTEAQAAQEKESIQAPSEEAVEIGVARAELREAQKRQNENPEGVTKAREKLMQLRFGNTPQERLGKMQARLKEMQAELGKTNMELADAGADIPKMKQAVKDLEAQIKLDLLMTPEAGLADLLAAPEVNQAAAKQVASAELTRLAPVTAKAAELEKKAEKEVEAAYEKLLQAETESALATAAQAKALATVGTLTAKVKDAEKKLQDAKDYSNDLMNKPGDEEGLAARNNAYKEEQSAEKTLKAAKAQLAEAKKALVKADANLALKNKPDKLSALERELDAKIQALKALREAHQQARNAERSPRLIQASSVEKTQEMPTTEQRLQEAQEEVKSSKTDIQWGVQGGTPISTLRERVRDLEKQLKQEKEVAKTKLQVARAELRQAEKVAKQELVSEQAKTAVEEAREKMMALRFGGPASPERTKLMEARLAVLEAQETKSPGTNRAIEHLRTQIAKDQPAPAAAAAPAPVEPAERPAAAAPTPVERAERPAAAAPTPVERAAPVAAQTPAPAMPEQPSKHTPTPRWVTEGIQRQIIRLEELELYGPGETPAAAPAAPT